MFFRGRVQTLRSPLRHKATVRWRDFIYVSAYILLFPSHFVERDNTLLLTEWNSVLSTTNCANASRLGCHLLLKQTRHCKQTLLHADITWHRYTFLFLHFVKCRHIAAVFLTASVYKLSQVSGYTLIYFPSHKGCRTNLLQGAEPFLRSRLSLSYSTISQHFMEPKGTLSCS
jgi:hypothetical protein